MKKMIENYLSNCSYKYYDFEWHYGRQGYYIMAHHKYGKDLMCITVNDVVDEILKKEVDKRIEM